MKGVLAEDYSNPTYKAAVRSILNNILMDKVKVPVPVALDSFIVHYKKWTDIVFNPKVKSAWRYILERYYESDNYRRLNEVVTGDPLLSRYAAINFLKKLYEVAKEYTSERQSQTQASQKQSDPVDGLIKYIENASTITANALVTAVSSALAREAEAILKDIETINTFSHIGLPIQKYLEKPDELRRIVKNKIIIHLAKMLRRARAESYSVKNAKIITLSGGRPLGVKKLQRWSELTHVLPTELLDEDLLTYKIASRTVLVRERYGGIPNYVVYVDKSGSMSEDIKYCHSPTRCEDVPKISFAAASALALAEYLKRHGSKLTLKMFDTEVHEPEKDLIDVLMRIRADSGTNITNVIADALEHHKDDKIVVITDGIDEVDEEIVKRAKSSNLDITFIFIKTDNELLRKYFRCVHIKEAKPRILFEV